MDPTTVPVLAPATPEIFLVCAGMALLMVGVFRKGDPTGLVSWLAIASLIVTGVLVLMYGGATDTPVFFGMFVTSKFAQFAKILILMGSALSIVLSSDYLRREQAQRFEFPVLSV